MAKESKLVIICQRCGRTVIKDKVHMCRPKTVYIKPPDLIDRKEVMAILEEEKKNIQKHLPTEKTLAVIILANVWKKVEAIKGT